MDKFFELLEKSVIFQGILVCMIGGTVCLLYATGKPVPDNLDRLLYAIVGFFFGAKQVVMASRARSDGKGG